MLKRIKEIADELIKVAASRETTKIKLLEFPSDEYERFVHAFHILQLKINN